MRKLAKLSIALALIGVMLIPPISVEAKAANITTTATGYTKAEDVRYLETGGYRCNWGARDEDCVFLSKYAQAFYTGSNVYETLSQKSGGTAQSNAPQSALYSSLKTLMSSKHKTQTSYQATRDMYKYTDCVSNDYSHISSFYSGTVLNGAWDGSTWNREHTWPNSKGLEGNDENDIIMLRPTSVSENSDRGNMAYGESSGYFDPGESVRGDCARIVLYVYTRWGNTGKMWGTSGVMENKNILLKWMEEDPVDTWEMGRNDSTEKITGTRNVFVDYPEYAWLLFSEDIPDDMVTPSGIAKNGGDVLNSSSSKDSSVNSSLEDSSSSEEITNSSSSEEIANNSSSEECEHESDSWLTLKSPTATESGQKMGVCSKCGKTVTVEIPPLGNTETEEHEVESWIILKSPTETESGQKMGVCSKCGKTVTVEIPALGKAETDNCSSSLQNGVGALIVLAIAGVALIKKKESYIEE